MTTVQTRRSFPFWALLAVSAAVEAALIFVTFMGAADLRPFFGNVHPHLATPVICAVGVGALYVLHRDFSFSIYETQSIKRGVATAIALAVPFMIAVTVADLVYRFPVDINVPPPAAFVFYPAIGLIAQLALHIVPFAILLYLLNSLLPTDRPDRWMWVCIVLASSIEAAFQLASSVDNGGSLGLAVFVATSLFSFGVVELYLFRRFDYATMYVFRITYYCYWHIVWGDLRLHWLF